MGLGPKQRRLPPPAILRGFYPHPIFAPNKRAQTTVLQSGPGTQTEDRVWKVWLRPVTLRVWKLEGLRARWLQEGLGSPAILTVRLIVGVDVNRCPPPPQHPVGSSQGQCQVAAVHCSGPGGGMTLLQALSEGYERDFPEPALRPSVGAWSRG